MTVILSPGSYKSRYEPGQSRYEPGQSWYEPGQTGYEPGKYESMNGENMNRDITIL